MGREAKNKSRLILVTLVALYSHEILIGKDGKNRFRNTKIFCYMRPTTIYTHLAKFKQDKTI